MVETADNILEKLDKLRKDNPDYNPPLTIRDEAMNNFIMLTSIKNPHIIPVTSDKIQFKLGDFVVGLGVGLLNAAVDSRKQPIHVLVITIV